MKADAKLKAVLAALMALAVPAVAHATYNANISGVIVSVVTYDDGLVLFTLQNQPTAHPGCNPNYFAIDPALNPDIKAMLLSRALVAKSSGETLFIGYDGQGSCVSGYIRVHRIG